MWSNKSYPVTSKLEADLTLVAREMGMEKLPTAVQQMVDTLGEYEHGTAEPEDVFSGVDLLFGEGEDLTGEEAEEQRRREALMAYAAVLEDLALSILHQS